MQTLLESVERIVQESKITNPRSILIPLREEKLGKAGKSQEDKKAIVY